MKSSDIALVVLLAAVSVVVSYWLGNMILGDPSEDIYKITYVENISSEVSTPDLETFNPSSLNPTVEVIIGKCKDGEEYDTDAKRCKQASKKSDEDGEGEGEESFESPELESLEPDDLED